MLSSRSKEYQELLKDQIQQASKWLSNNKEEIVSKIEGISDFQIIIDLRNGNSIPTIKIIQENAFYKYGE